MSKRKRRKHSKEFKEGAVNLVTKQGYRVSEAARNLGIHPNVLGRWERELEVNEGSDAAPGDLASMQSELKRLRKENKRLQMEREILKYKFLMCIELSRFYLITNGRSANIAKCTLFLQLSLV